MLLLTRDGPYVSPDAVSYIGTARGLAAGDGFTAPPGTPPVGHFAPLYPVALAALDVVGLDPVDGARLLNGLLLGATVLVVGLVLRRATRKWWPALAGGVLVVFATDALAYYSSALSDPLFVLLSLLGIVALAGYLEARRPALLGAATALTALALLTRYVGIALVAAGAVALVAYGAGRRWRGVLEAAAFSTALVPVTAWVFWARRAHGGGSEGDIVFHPFGGAYLERGAGNLIEWIAPGALPWWLGALVAAAVIALVMWVAMSSPNRTVAEPVPGPGTDLSRLPVLCGLLGGAYIAVVVADRLLLDASALPDKRLLLPPHMIAIVGLLAFVGVRAARGSLKFVSVGALGVVVLLQLAGATVWVRDSVDNRGGYTSRPWRESPVIAAVRNLPPGVPVYTNGPDAIWFLTGRATEMLPAEEDYLTGRSNPHYRTAVGDMGARLRAGNGLVVYFQGIKSRHSLPTVADLRRFISLQQLAADQVGTIYGSQLGTGQPRRSSATSKARSSDWRALRRGSQMVR